MSVSPPEGIYVGTVHVGAGVWRAALLVATLTLVFNVTALISPSVTVARLAGTSLALLVTCYFASATLVNSDLWLTPLTLFALLGAFSAFGALTIKPVEVDP